MINTLVFFGCFWDSKNESVTVVQLMGANDFRGTGFWIVTPLGFWCPERCRLIRLLSNIYGEETRVFKVNYTIVNNLDHLHILFGHVCTGPSVYFEWNFQCKRIHIQHLWNSLGCISLKKSTLTFINIYFFFKKLGDETHTSSEPNSMKITCDRKSRLHDHVTSVIAFCCMWPRKWCFE